MKSTCRKIFNITRHQKLPVLTREELNYLINLICMEINNIPYQTNSEVTDLLLSPADLVYVSQRKTLLGQVDSHLPDVVKLCDRLSQYRDTLNQVLMDTFKSRIKRLRHGINPRGKKSMTQEIIHTNDLVLLIRPKSHLVEVARVLDHGNTQAHIKFRDGSCEWHSISNLVPLSSQELQKAQGNVK